MHSTQPIPPWPPAADTRQPRSRRVNGVALHTPGEALDAEALRQRACTELLRQAAIAGGLLDADDPPDD